jgi:hypothetical protein
MAVLVQFELSSIRGGRDSFGAEALIRGQDVWGKNIQGIRLTFRLAFESMGQYRIIPQDSYLLPKLWVEGIYTFLTPAQP